MRSSTSRASALLKAIWDAEVRESTGEPGRFKKLNIIYGRNYSGKTTLSRVFRSFEIGQLPAKYENPDFTIKASSGILTQAKLATEGPPIRVYNRDFVESNLKFLRDEEGHITPFAVLGAANKDIEDQIAAVNAELGSKEDGSGLRGGFAKKREEYVVAKAARELKAENLNKKLVDKANAKQHGVKHNPLYKNPYYDIRSLSADIAAVKAQKLSPLMTSPVPRRLLCSRKLLFNPFAQSHHSSRASNRSKSKHAWQRRRSSDRTKRFKTFSIQTRWPSGCEKAGICTSTERPAPSVAVPCQKTSGARWTSTSTRSRKSSNEHLLR